MMRGLQKSKRVCWASDGNLCQVKLFLSEDSPSIVGAGTQDHLQPKKKSGHLYNNTWSVAVPDDGLPPGFEKVNPEAQLLKNKLTQISLAKWKCPPRFVLDPSSRVTTGEESAEVEIQNQRELRVLEAVYPRSSAIPPNPTVSLDAEGSICDDTRTPLVPITPIEEEDMPEEPSNDPTFADTPQPPGFAKGRLPSSQYGAASAPNPPLNGRVQESAQPQLLAAASAALSALVSGSSGPEKLIDHELLVKILNNPTILEEFMKRQGNNSGSQAMATSSQHPQMISNQPAPVSAQIPVPVPPPIVTMSNPPPPHFSQAANHNLPSSTLNSKEPVYPHMIGKLPSSYPHPLPTTPSTAQAPLLHTGTAPPRDMNYYKSLIQQHGGERQQEVNPPQFMSNQSHHLGGSGGLNPDPVDSNTRPARDLRPKINKPCLFFNSSKGCRHGAKCVYQHASTLQQRTSSIPEAQSAKRMKMSRDMRGSQPYN